MPTQRTLAESISPSVPYLVRIKPYDPKKGSVLQRYTVAGITYREDKGWYPVTSIRLAEGMRELRQDENNENSPAVFDVCTPEEARAIDAREAKSKRAGGRRTAEDAEDEA